MVSHKDSPAQASSGAEVALASSLEFSADEEKLRSLVEDPALDESHLLVLLKRPDLPASLLELIGKKKSWRDSYPVRLALALHPRMPRPSATKLLRELHLMDLVRISTLPAAPAELRCLAEGRILAQLPQLPLGQRLMLARRASGRVAAGVLAGGPVTAAKPALNNPLLTEAHLLKTLAQDAISSRSLEVIAQHKKWSGFLNIRVALIRQKDTPVDRVLAFLPEFRAGKSRISWSFLVFRAERASFCGRN